MLSVHHLISWIPSQVSMSPSRSSSHPKTLFRSKLPGPPRRSATTTPGPSPPYLSSRVVEGPWIASFEWGWSILVAKASKARHWTYAARRGSRRPWQRPPRWKCLKESEGLIGTHMGMSENFHFMMICADLANTYRDVMKILWSGIVWQNSIEFILWKNMLNHVESLDVGRVPVSHVESPRILSLSVPPRHCWALTLAPWPGPNQRLRWWSPAGCRGRSSSARICPGKSVFFARGGDKNWGASGLASFEGNVNFKSRTVPTISWDMQQKIIRTARNHVLNTRLGIIFFCIFLPTCIDTRLTHKRTTYTAWRLLGGGRHAWNLPTHTFFFKCIRLNGFVWK